MDAKVGVRNSLFIMNRRAFQDRPSPKHGAGTRPLGRSTLDTDTTVHPLYGNQNGRAQELQSEEQEIDGRTFLAQCYLCIISRLREAVCRRRRGWHCVPSQMFSSSANRRARLSAANLGFSKATS